MTHGDQSIRTIRNVALVGPYSSGKTTLLESILFVTGAITRKGSIKEGNTVSDSSPEARDRQMGVEVSLGSCTYKDIQFNFLDCPGSIEFAQEAQNALVGAGMAIVVCEAEREKLLTLAPLFKFLDDWEIPHLVFLNKMNRAKNNYGEILAALKEISSRPLVPQQYPIRQHQDLVGYIDLITEQAYHYHPHSPADPVALPADLQLEEQITREEMLETLSEFDDHLLEELLEDIEPTQTEIIADFKKELGADQIVPVFFGIGEADYGVRPLLDALVNEAPAPEVTARRRGLHPQESGEAIAQVLKTYYSPQGGKLSLVRVWQGTLKDGMALNGQRIGGLYQIMGNQQTSVQTASVGSVVAISRLDGVQTGDTLWAQEGNPLPQADTMQPVYAQAIAPKNRKDEVKISGALAKLVEEDPSLQWVQEEDTHEVLLWGQGDIHLKVALDRLERKYNLPMVTQNPQVPYKETIRQRGSVHGRYKHQTGGHGAYGDVYLDLQPQGRGGGFAFHETIVGGVVPRQYIPGVEMGVRESLGCGPLGFPVVDLDVTLTNGSYHAVDSSEQAFKQAARIAMADGLPQCAPQLLEPVLLVTLSIPQDFTAKAMQLVTGRRGQILGYEAISTWKGWDQLNAHLPQAEMQTLIVELRSLTLGVGFFQWKQSHLQEVPDKIADSVVQGHQERVAAG